MSMESLEKINLKFIKLNILPFWKSFVTVLIPLIFLPIPIIGANSESRCGYVIIIMALYWMFDVFPLAITVFIPIFAFPMLGILSTEEVCLNFMKSTNMMFLGGLMVAVAVEFCNLHTRIALFVILHVGQSPRRLMAGFIITTMFLSMWISNTASTAMMAPIVDAILREIDECEEDSKSENKPQILNGISSSCYVSDENDDKNTSAITATFTSEIESSKEAEEKKNLRTMFFLSIAYAANIGGTGTLNGTSPNLILKSTMDSSFSEPTGLNFGSWMAFNVPGMILCSIFAALWLQYLFIGFGKSSRVADSSPEKIQMVRNLIQRRYDALGSLSFHEGSVLALFITLVLGWLFREPGFMSGWTSWFKMAFGEENISIKAATPAMFVVVFLFVVPAQIKFWPFVPASKTKPLTPSIGCLTWEVIHEKVPWDLVLLMGGAFAMAAGAEKSGLSAWMGGQMRGLNILPPWLIVIIVSFMTAIVTEVASNSATASVLMPILKDLGLGICVNPLYLMIPSAACASYAFMLPVATAPNAIVHRVSGMRTLDMMKAGLMMNIGCVIIINLMINSLGVAMFDIHNLPDWVNSTTGTYAPQCS